ncbi:MAG: NfeD family protein [Methanobrevibacter sp.]|nr:NfeD family protein [Methanobrevibacter sp.]
MDVLIWIFIAIIFIIFELTTNTFVLIWFGVSALVSAALNYLGFDIYIQITVFIILSLVLIFLTRKFATKVTQEPTKKATSERLIGMKATVVKKLSDNEAIVKVRGENWRAVIPNDANVDDTVRITSIDSIRLVTEKTD